MSVIIETDNLTYEFTEDGELLFPGHDLAYDQAALEFGYSKTKAVDILDMWNEDATSTFIGLLFDDMSRDIARIITRAWLDFAVERFGIKELNGIKIDETIKQLDDAILAKDENAIDDIKNQVGNYAAGYQRQAWMHGGYAFGSLEHAHNARVRLAIASAITSYIVVSQYSIPTWSTLWRTHGGKSGVINYITDIPNMCARGISVAGVPNSYAAVVDEREVIKVRKEFVGAAVRDIVKAEEA